MDELVCDKIAQMGHSDGLAHAKPHLDLWTMPGWKAVELLRVLHPTCTNASHRKHAASLGSASNATWWWVKRSQVMWKKAEIQAELCPFDSWTGRVVPHGPAESCWMVTLPSLFQGVPCTWEAGLSLLHVMARVAGVSPLSCKITNVAPGAVLWPRCFSNPFSLSLTLSLPGFDHNAAQQTAPEKHC